MSTPPHLLRVVDERLALALLVQKLGSFLKSPKFATVEAAEAERLERQHVYMSRYLEVLDERLTAAGLMP